MNRHFIFFLISVVLVAGSNSARGLITVSTPETWDGGQIHGISPTGSGSKADPYVYVIGDGMSMASSGVIKTGDEYVIFDFRLGTGGLDMAKGGYFDITGSSRLSSAGGIVIELGGNNLTGAGDFKSVDISKDSKDISIGGLGDVTINSVYARVRDARAGNVSVDVGGSVDIGSIDTQDEATGGNDAGNVIVRGFDVTISSIDTRAMRTESSTASSGTILIEGCGYDAINSLSNTVNCTGPLDTNSPAGIDGGVRISGVVVQLEGDFGADTGDGPLDIYAGVIQHGMAARDLFIDDSGGEFSAVHNIAWGTAVCFASAKSSDFEGAGPVRVDVVLNEAGANAITVEYAVTGGSAEGNDVDYSISPSPLVFAAGDTNESISLSIVDDGADEDDETIEIALLDVSGGAVSIGEPSQHIYTIVDATPYVQFRSETGGGSEELPVGKVGVNLSWPSEETVTVDYEVVGGTATNGSDYNLAAGTLVFEPGRTSGEIEIPMLSDPCRECEETIILGLSDPVNCRLGETLQHSYSITEICFAPFADSNTVALWLFDEEQYRYTTLTDAGKYEYDLRLGDGGALVDGRFGNALRMSGGAGYNVYYAEWKGIICSTYMRGPAGELSGLWGPTIAPDRLLSGLAGDSWTCEFWLKLYSVPTADVAIVHFGHAYSRGVSFNLASDAWGFVISNSYGGLGAICPTNPALLADGHWHHVVFTASAGEIKHYLDGQQQARPAVWSEATEPVPESNIPASLAETTYGIFDASKDYELFRRHRFNLSIGENRHGNAELDGAIDELRFSDVVRYEGTFEAGESFSRSYGSTAAPPSVPTGPELLFACGSGSGPVELGSRKHLFIDEALVDTKENVQLAINPPVNPQLVNRSYSSGDYWVVDHNDKVYLFTPDGYASDRGITRLWISEDGLDFDSPELGVIEYEGTTANNIVLHLSPMWGCFFKDTNRNIPELERFKLTSWSSNRGIYLYSSGDMIHWRRNETIMLPLVSGGNAETFWDDQRGSYTTLLKRDSSFHYADCPPAGGRVTVGFSTREVSKPLQFGVMSPPYFEGWSLPVVTCEGPIVFPVNAYGQVYRTRAIKYPWAPDVYLAFIWRMDEDEVRQTELGVSRDGVNWTTCGELGMYMPTGGSFNGETIVERLAHGGLVLRGNEIWQYADFGTGPHSAGEEFFVRLTQRLDGFMSLDAGPATGSITTRPLVFEGNKLVLNVTVSGTVKVGVLDEGSVPVPGFDTTDCDAVSSSVRHIVTWRGCSDIGELSGTTVRLRIEMQNAKLYALQFCGRGDLNGDGTVDFADIKCFGEKWLLSMPTACKAADVDGNGFIAFEDYALLALEWLEYK